MARWAFFAIVGACLFLSGALARHFELPPYHLIRSTLSKAPTIASAPQYAARMKLFDSIPGTAEIVMLGDSHIELGPWNELLPGFKLLNRGISGDTSDGVLARLSEVMSRRPKTVFLMVGINDVYRGVPPATIADNITKILVSLERGGINTILHGILPVSGNPLINDKVRQTNSILTNKIIVELSALTKNGELSKSYTWDGLHLNGPAYLVWRDAILPHAATHQVRGAAPPTAP